MKTPTWAYVVGIIMIVFSGCGACSRFQEVKMPAELEKQQKMFGTYQEEESPDTAQWLGLDSAETATGDSLKELGDSLLLEIQRNNPHMTPEAAEQMNKMMENMFTMSEFEKIWTVRFAYIGLFVIFIYLMGGLFLLIRKPFSIKLAYAALIISILFSIARWSVLASGGESFSMVSMMMGVSQAFGVIIDVILLIVVWASDKTAYNTPEAGMIT